MRFFVTGTDTGVGKTVIGGGLVLGFKRVGLSVGVLKPAESGCGDTLHPADGAFLVQCAGSGQPLEEAVPYRYALPLAPGVAATEEMRSPVDPCGIAATLNLLEENYDTVIVEGAGGLLVPLCDGFTCGDLARLLDAPLVVVARPDLGTINHTLLTVRMAQAMGMEVRAVVINGHEPETGGLEQRSNPRIIAGMLHGVPVRTVPLFPGLDVARCGPGALERYPWEELAGVLLKEE